MGGGVIYRSSNCSWYPWWGYDNPRFPDHPKIKDRTRPSSQVQPSFLSDSIRLFRLQPSSNNAAISQVGLPHLDSRAALHADRLFLVAETTHRAVFSVFSFLLWFLLCICWNDVAYQSITNNFQYCFLHSLQMQMMSFLLSHCKSWAWDRPCTDIPSPLPREWVASCLKHVVVNDRLDFRISEAPGPSSTTTTPLPWPPPAEVQR